MTVLGALALICLTLGVGIMILCCCGVLAMRRPTDRLHYLSPATVLGAPLIAAAIVLSHPGTQGGIKAILIALVLLIMGPILTHATGSAIRRWESEEKDQ